METLFHAARNSIYKIIKTDINESKKGHELQEICQTIGASGRTSWMSAIYSFKYGHQTSQQRYHMQVSGHTRPWDSNRLLLPLQVSLPASTRQYWQRNWKQINYVGQSSGEKQTNKQTPSYQRCPSSCPRNCGCSSYISPSWEGLTDHFWRHSQMGRKAQMPKSVLFSSIPKYSDEVNEEKSSFIFCVPLEHNGCSS